jgi:hypothetical protein
MPGANQIAANQLSYLRPSICAGHRIMFDEAAEDLAGLDPRAPRPFASKTPAFGTPTTPTIQTASKFSASFRDFLANPRSRHASNHRMPRRLPGRPPKSSLAPPLASLHLRAENPRFWNTRNPNHPNRFQILSFVPRLFRTFRSHRPNHRHAGLPSRTPQSSSLGGLCISAPKTLAFRDIHNPNHPNRFQILSFVPRLFRTPTAPKHRHSQAWHP